MRQQSRTRESSSKRLVKNIRRVTRKQYSSEEKIRIVLDGLRGEFSIAELCRREGIAESLYYSGSKEFLEAGKRRSQERLTGALLDRLTHHVHILEMNGESYRLNQSQKRRKSPKIPA